MKLVSFFPLSVRSPICRLCTAVSVSLMSLATPSIAQTVYQESNGVVVMDIEFDHPPPPRWTSSTQLEGYTGTAYYVMTGSDSFRVPGLGVLEYPFVISTSG